MARALVSIASLLILALVAMTGCGKEEPEGPATATPAEAPKVEEAKDAGLEACVRAVGALASAGPQGKIELLVEGCSRALPMLDAFAAHAPEQREARLAESDFACTPEARAELSDVEPQERMARALASCGREHYRIPEGQEALLSLEWFVVERIGREIAGAASDRLAAEIGPARIALPLPASAPELYRLPRSERAVPVAAAAYVVVRADSVSAGATPEAELTAEGARIAEVTGGAFPGTDVALDELASRVREVAGDDPSAPLLLADAELPAARLLSVIRSLGDHGARIAVAGADSRASALEVAVGGGDPSDEAIALVLSRAGYELGRGDARRRVPRADDRFDPTALEEAFQELTGDSKPSAVVFFVRDTATVEDLAHALAVVAAAGVGAVTAAESDPLAPKAAGAKPRKEPAPAADPEPKKRGGPSVRVGTVNARGNLDGRAALRLVRQQQGRLRACYQAGLASNPDLGGTMTVHIEVTPAGRVSSVRASGVDVKVGECVAGVVRSLALPAPGGGSVTASFPIRFDPG